MKSANHKPFRIFFPEPIVLHGADEKRMIDVAIEYLRQSGKVRIEPLFAPDRPPFETFKGPTCKGCYALGTACGTCEKCAWERKNAPGAMGMLPREHAE